MNEPLDELYLDWLHHSVDARKGKLNLIRALYTKEFVWFVPNDDNRAEEGKDLRYEFADALGLEDMDPDWMSLGCSMLEMIIGLSRQLSFLEDGTSRLWFWHLMDNLQMTGRSSSERIEEVLDNVIWRTYQPNGQGGLFPLRDPRQDQRDVELWYQLNAYLLEC